MPSPWLNNSYDLPSRFFLCFFPHRDERLFNPGPLDLHAPSSPHMTFFFSLVRTGFAGLTERRDLPTIDWMAGIFKAVGRIIVSSYTVFAILWSWLPRNYTGSDLWDFSSVFTRSTAPQWGCLRHQAPTDPVPELAECTWENTAKQ